MAVLARGAMILAAFFFLSGFIITVLSASVRAVKIWLVIILVAGLILNIVALVLTGNAFVYLMFQFITIILMICFMVILGATCGYGLYLLLHRKPPGLDMRNQDPADFLLLEEFCALEGVTEEKALARIHSGYYAGGSLNGSWYVHRGELGEAGRP